MSTVFDELKIKVTHGNSKTLIVGQSSSTKLICDIVDVDFNRELTIICPNQDSIEEYTKKYPCAIIHTSMNTFECDDDKTKLKTIVFDSVMDNNAIFFKDQVLTDVLFSARNLGYKVIIRVKFPNSLMFAVQNVDFIFAQYNDFISVKKKLYETCFGVFPTFKVFMDSFDKCAEQDGCYMVIHNSEYNITRRFGERSITDKIKYYNTNKIKQSHEFCDESFYEYAIKKDKQDLSLIIGAQNDITYDLMNKLIKNDKERELTIVSWNYKIFIERYPKATVCKDFSLFTIDKNPKNPKTLIIDNIVCPYANDPILHDLFINGRHYGYKIIVRTFQDLTPKLRANIDTVFAFGTIFPENEKKIYDFYGGAFKTYNIFDKIFKVLTHNNKCMVISLKGTFFLEQISYCSQEIPQTIQQKQELQTSIMQSLFKSVAGWFGY